MDQEDLEARFRRRDREAFLDLYARHAPVVRAVVARFFVRPFEREEAVQEIWLLVHRMAHTFDPARGAFTTWLRTLAANRCKELLRARGRRPNADVPLDEGSILAADDPETHTRQSRLRQAVEAFMATLGKDEAEVFRLSLLDERTHDETAAATGLSPRRCKYLRMKLLLRASLDPKLRAALGEAHEP